MNLKSSSPTRTSCSPRRSNVSAILCAWSWRGALANTSYDVCPTYCRARRWPCPATRASRRSALRRARTPPFLRAQSLRLRQTANRGRTWPLPPPHRPTQVRLNAWREMLRAARRTGLILCQRLEHWWLIFAVSNLGRRKRSESKTGLWKKTSSYCDGHSEAWFISTRRFGTFRY